MENNWNLVLNKMENFLYGATGIETLAFSDSNFDASASFLAVAKTERPESASASAKESPSGSSFPIIRVLAIA